MKLFDVYPLFDITPVRAQGAYIWDDKGHQYLDFYGGHAVISIGHTHPHYVKRITDQLHQIGFYSNAVKLPLQEELAAKLGRASGYDDYQLFLCNSGAEANENALKLASFHNGRKKIVAISHSFHGRTSLAVAVTDDEKISAFINKGNRVVFVPMNDEEAVARAIDDETCAVIIEGIQGVGGINVPTHEFLKTIEAECQLHGAVLILDEIQSGYGRTGKFFAYQYSGIKPHMITTAKGMGNGFPIAGVLIHPDIKAKHGMLGTTFGGNHLACVAALAVLEVMEQEDLIHHAGAVGQKLMNTLEKISGVKKVKGMGLMIGIETHGDAATIRKDLLFKENIFTGYSGVNKTIRLLPPLNISQKETEQFLHSFSKIISTSAYQPVSTSV